jgi:hypothetical protein
MPDHTETPRAGTTAEPAGFAAAWTLCKDAASGAR